MRAVVLLLALAAGCRDDATPFGHDLSSATLYCPARPPTAPYACDATAIPFCSYPDLELTCVCTGGLLVCPADGGVTD